MALLFLDTEFTNLHADARLLSIALYHSDDNYFYAEFSDIDKYMLSPWVIENVLPHLEYQHVDAFLSEEGTIVKLKGNNETVKTALFSWIAKFENIEVWADVLAYDWVFFCNIFGGATQIPKNIFYIPFDLSTLLKACHLNPDLNRFDFISDFLTEGEKGRRHHALIDAKVGRLCLKKVMTTSI